MEPTYDRPDQVNKANPAKTIKARHTGSDGKPVVSQQYAYRIDRATGKEYKEYLGTKESEALDPKYNGEILSKLDWDDFALKMARSFDNKVNELLSLPDNQWIRTPKTRRSRWWKFWTWKFLLTRKSEIALIKSQLTRDEIEFKKIDEILDLAKNPVVRTSVLTIVTVILLSLFRGKKKKTNGFDDSEEYGHEMFL